MSEPIYAFFNHNRLPTNGESNPQIIRHYLVDGLGVLSGQDTWEGIIDFSEMSRDFLNHYGYFSACIPSADTVARVEGLLSPKEFQSAFIDWMKDCLNSRKVRLSRLIKRRHEGLTTKPKVIKRSICQGPRMS